MSRNIRCKFHLPSEATTHVQCINAFPRSYFGYDSNPLKISMYPFGQRLARIQVASISPLATVTQTTTWSSPSSPSKICPVRHSRHRKTLSATNWGRYLLSASSGGACPPICEQRGLHPIDCVRMPTPDYHGILLRAVSSWAISIYHTAHWSLLSKMHVFPTFRHDDRKAGYCGCGDPVVAARTHCTKGVANLPG